MTPYRRLMDMLPALVTFAVIAAFATYVAVAWVIRDPWWLHTVLELTGREPTAP